MFIRPWLEALKSRWMPGKRRSHKRLSNDKPLQSQVETLEEKIVLSAFDLVTVIPNQGVFLANNTTLSEAPREMTLRFSPGQTIDPNSLGSITVVRAGLDGIFDDPSTGTPESTDDVSVGLGYVGAGDNPNEVIVRFAATLPDDKYQIRIDTSTTTGLKGNLVGAVNDTLIPDAGKTYKSFNYELDLGAQVESVIPQPVIRDQLFSTTQLSSLTDGDLVTITAGPYTYKFEINLLPNGTVNPGNIAVNIPLASTASQIADALVLAINTNASAQLTASDSANLITVSGVSYEPVVSFSTTKTDAFAKANLTVVGNGTQLADGDLVRLTLTNPVTSANTVFTFELNKAPNNIVSGGNIRVDFAAGDSQATIAAALATAINTKLSINLPTKQVFATVIGTSIAVAAVPTLGTPALSSVQASTGLSNPFLTLPYGALQQKANKVVVYFNQDQLNPAIAQDPTYYRLINVANGAVLLPQSVSYQYNAQTGLSAAVLTFGSSLANASYNLKVGVSSEPNGTSASVTNAIKVGTVFTGQPVIVNEYLGDGTGNSSDATDVDVYQFTTVLGGVYTFTLDSSATLDGVLEFLDTNGNVVLGPQNATGAGGTETLMTGALGAGTFYVRVTSSGGTGGYKLTIASTEASSGSDDNSSFLTATNLGSLGTGGVTLTSQIEAQGAFVSMPPLPGGSDEPGHRDLPSGAFTGLSAPEVGHGIGGGTDPSSPGAIATQTYSFPLTYGGNLTNQITPEQKEIIRQIFQIYSYYTGIQFREVASGGAEQIVVGDIRVNAPNLDPGAAGGISGSPLIINAIFYANDNTYGGGFTTTAFHEIGHNLGLGHSYDIPSIQGAGLSGEGVFPGDNDLIHLLRLLPDNSSDIDLYKFNITQTGTLSAQTVAQRLGVTNLLNSELTLYRQEPSGAKTVIARNDDFYSKDSGLEIALQPGTYFIGVTSTGNDEYDPSISNSGFGGRSDGTYQLQLDFKPDTPVTSGLRDATGQVLDGDHDGKTGGEYNTWFKVANTVFVDKLAPAGGSGTVGSPYQTISAGLAVAVPGSIVRIVGNGGADGNDATIADNVPYAIGRDYVSNNPLADGSTFQVPQGVTVMIDAGTLIKVHGQTIDVGTSSQGTDRSGGALQVLGTPVNNVTFTSWRDDSKGSIDDGTNGAATGADWGGIVYRQDSDVNSGLSGVFLNQVNHATLQYGGGQVGVDGGPLRVYNVIDMETSRPTITNNIITNNADAAISANPDSFKADDGRIGPDIHGNTVTNNSTNGLFIRIQTALGGASESLNVIARFDDTDITHVIAQNLIINGDPAGALSSPLSARLMIDPGTIVKLSGARIETGTGSSNLIAEGTAANPIRFTSQQDDKYGVGGTFDLKNDGFAPLISQPAAGNWSGIFLNPTSTASLDHVSITYAGGSSEIAGNTDNFNPIEDWQAKLRVTNTVFENNLGGQAATGRGGRGGNDSSVIYVRGAQPVIVNNVFRDNIGNVISINANSMQDVVMPDYGRSTGDIDDYTSFDDNYGPLVRLNKYDNNSTNGMNIRPEELTIESIWDDTDIAHVVRGTITSNEFHTYGGLRLQSSATGSLVVKLQGAGAGFAATGDPLEIVDRIGGSVQVVGQPGFPVILTSLKDDTVSTGFLPNGFPLFDTNNDGSASAPAPGDWNSISFDRYSNDRNVAEVNETEPGLNQGNDINSTVGNPQSLGNLAPNENSGDENRRLGFEVHGFISPDSPGDVDVYSFSADAGTEVWIDLDQTDYALDSMVELVNSAGLVLARSLNSQTESANPAGWLASGIAGTLAGTVGNSNLNTLTKDSTLGGDFYTSNYLDAGFRAVLPGTAGSTNTYFIRVRSQPVAGQEAAAIPVGGNGLTSGKYELQVRLRQQDEQPGSTVRYADIRYATNGIELRGLPSHSIIMGESAETTADNDAPDGSQYLGPFLQTDRNTLSVSGNLASATDVDFYRFTVDYSQVQVIGGARDGGKFFPTMFDIDWADGLTRPDTTIAVYNSAKTLIYIGRASDLADDQPAPGQGQDLDDLARGSLGTLDPSIGTVNLPAGVAGSSEAGGVNPNPPVGGLTTYYVAVFSNGMLPTALTANFNSIASAADQLVRLEPINSIKRVVEDHIGYTGYGTQGSNVAPVSGPLFNLTDSISLDTNIRAFTLSDVNLFVTTRTTLRVVDPFNGSTEIQYPTNGGLLYQDLDMRSDGRLFAVRSPSGAPQAGLFVELNTGTGGELSAQGDGIADTDGDPNTVRFQSNSSASTAMAIRRTGSGSYDYVYYATANSDDYPNPQPPPNLGGASKLYRGDATSGNAAWSGSNTGATGLVTDSAGTITTLTMGLQFLNGTLYGVSAGNQLYIVSSQASIGGGGTNVGNPNSAADNTITSLNQSTPTLVNTASIVDYSALLNPGETFAGIADAPQNVENQKYADFLFVITSDGRILCIDPNAADAASSLQTVFDTDGDRIADSQYLDTGIVNPTGLAFSPVDYNLWHPTARRDSDPGHGVATTTETKIGNVKTPGVDNSRTPSKETDTLAIGSESWDYAESVGGASMYFGIENYGAGSRSNYFQFDSGGQYGVESSVSQQDLTANSGSIHNNYNVPGGTSGSMVTNAFDLEGYTTGDQPTLYFNYWLQTQGAGGKVADSMLDSARVYVSIDDGLSWSLLATNNSTLSADKNPDAELPAFLSTNRDASPKPNQGVQELYETSSWRQARVDLADYVGNPQVKLRFDFSTSGNTGTVLDPLTGLRIVGDDKSDPTFQGDTGNDFGVGSTTTTTGAQNNAFEGFYVDDITVGFAGRGEMVTGTTVAGQGTSFTDLNTNGVAAIGGRPTLDPDPTAAKQLLTGGYQLEIRRGEEYGALFDPTKSDVIISPTLDINDRLVTGQTVFVGNQIADGDTVTVYDGLITKVFEFDTNGSVGVGNIAVNVAGLNTITQKGTIASLLASKITTTFSGRNTVIAKAVGAGVNSDRVDIFKAISVTINGGPVTATVIPSPLEDNDTIATSADSLVTAGANGLFTGSGNIGDGTYVANDVDMYSMVLSVGQVVAIDVDSPVDAFGFGDPILRIFDAAGVELAVSDDDPAPGEAIATFGAYLNFVAPATGTYYFGISGYSNFLYDPSVADSGTGSISTFDYTFNITSGTAPLGLTVDTYNRRGDDNLQRQQGQFIIENNAILSSLTNGVWIDDDDRFGSVPHPGAPLNTPVQNTGRLITGLYVQNNVIADSGTNGINIDGDSNTALGAAVVPFVKIVNNTIVGHVNDVSEFLESIGAANVTAVAQSILFSEPANPLGTTDPTYSFLNLPVLGDMSVSFGGAFVGQGVTTTDVTTIANGVSTVESFATLGDATPNGTLQLDSTAPVTQIVAGGANSPELTGTPSPLLGTTPNAFNGPISILFSVPVGGFTLDVSNLTAFGALTIQAFDVNGGSLGIVKNSRLGTQTMGLMSSSATPVNQIAGISIYVTGTDQRGFAIDNLQFGGFSLLTQAPFTPSAPIGTGIRVGLNTSPTLMNNAIVDTATAINITRSGNVALDGVVPEPVIEANLYGQNTTNVIRNGLPASTGNNALVEPNSIGMYDLFVNPASNNFYPASGSALIDSSRSTFNDRATYIAVVGPLGIPQSPIIAPIYDSFGQLRVDDVNQAGPPNQPGLGQNPFQDRGALERADFEGGVVIPTAPQDNDGSGVDLDPSPTTIWIDSATVSSPFDILTSFTLQLIDTGIGIDDSTVDLDGSDFIVLKNGVRLNDPATGIVDYIFTYNQNTNEAIFTSVSTFELDARYQIIVNPAGIQDLAGNDLQNNQSVPITPANPNIPSPFDTSLLYFTYVITDGKNDGPTASLGSVQLPQSPLTGAPVTINEDGSVTFSSATNNAITVLDKDAFLATDGDPNTGALGGRIRVTISVPSSMGSLLLAPGSTTNLVNNGGGATPTGSPLIDQYVLEGRIDDINTALDGLTFTPTPDFPIGLPAATVNITIFAEDLGKFGPPAPGTTDPKSTTTLLPIVINPVNDAPTLTITTPSPITILEDKVTSTQIDLSGITAGGGENQILTITVINSDTTGIIPNGNIVINYTSPNATGNIQFTAAPNRFTLPGQPITLTIRVTDNGINGGDQLFIEKQVKINITDVNDAPTINQPGNVTVLEDAVTQTVNLNGIGIGAFESVSQTLTLTATSNDQTLIPDSAISVTYTGGSTAQLFYTPAANRNGGPVTITIKAKDSGGTLNGGIDTATTTFTVTVTPVNDEPTVTVPGPITINEDDASNPQHITLTGISPGPFESSQSVSTITITSNNQSVIPDANIVQGALSGGNLPLTITPLANQSGLVTITVTITDDGANGGGNGDDNTVTKTFTINVLPVNDQPIFNLTPPLPPFTVLEDAAQQTLTLTGISAGPANESGQALVLSAVSSDTNLIASPIVSSIVGGQATVKYTPIANANGHATITVTLKDSGGTANGGNDTYTQVYDVFVTAVNDAPTLNFINDPAPILEDVGQQTINMSGITAGPANENLQTLTITAAITSGNPNLVNNFLASAINGAGQATLKYTPVANEFGTAVVTVTITDSGTNGGGNGDVNVVTRTFTVTVTGVNDRPTLTVISDQTSNEDAGTQTVNLAGISVGQPNEAPPQTLTFIVTSDNPALIPNNPTNLSVVYNQGDSIGQLLYKAVPNGFGTANITVTLKDDGLTANGGVDTLVRTFKITVNQVQDAPTDILLSGTSVFENQPVGTVIGTLSMNQTTDVDLPDDNFTYSIVGGTGLGFFQVAGSQLQTSQVLDFETNPSFTVTVRVTDRFGLTFDKTNTITVQNLNDAPTLDALSPVTFGEDPVNPVVISLTGVSAGFGESQNITITATSSNPALFSNPIPVNYTSPNTTGTLTLSPNLNANGTATITVTMHDNGGTLNGGVDTIVRTFQVTVNPVNDPPSDISLTNDTIAEIPAGTSLPTSVLVGDLSSTDPDNPAAGDTFTYSLVSGAGATDNAKFAIIGDELFATGNIDFDTQPNYTVRVRSTDSGTPTQFFDKVFTIHSTNVNEPATSITTAANPISGVPNSIPENRPADSVVGTLVAGDPDAGDVTTFALVTGAGSADNQLFKIVSGQLVANVSFNYEVKNSYTVRIRATDSHGLIFEGPVAISITNVNETPTNINLTNSVVVENSVPGTTIGSFSTVDPDAGDTFSYSLVSGAGATDNAKFEIVSGQLVVVVPPNYEDPGHFYSVRVRSTDAGGLTVEKAFTITILNVNEAPTELSLSNQNVNENKPIGTVVGTLGTDDQDVPESFTYALVSGIGSDDNSLFDISGDKLVTAASFDFETRTTYSVRVRTTDNGGHTLEKSFTITINDANDGPVITLSGSSGSTTGRKAVLIDSSAHITDIDSPNFDNGKLVVKIQSGEQTGDTLSIMKGSFNGLSLKTVKGHTVLRLGKQDIASVSGGVRGIPLTIQFGGGVSTELFQKVMQSV
ncbi:MAG: hypothetical protein JWN70_638, partial [Planctomycetaceae bacterium]|nr:hypothetical protein [Planctomycetaceae bacterium]